jgi:hypothetical protein
METFAEFIAQLIDWVVNDQHHESVHLLHRSNGSSYRDPAGVYGVFDGRPSVSGEGVYITGEVRSGWLGVARSEVVR